MSTKNRIPCSNYPDEREEDSNFTSIFPDTNDHAEQRN